MRPILTFAILGLAGLAWATSALAAGEVYKWTDDAGVVQYTDSPPEGRPFQQLKTSGSKPATPVPPPAVPAEPGAVDMAPAPAAGTDAANCAAARQNVENISRFSDVTMDRNGDGTPEKLTAEERASELERNQGLVTLYCEKEVAAEAEPAADGE